MQVTFRLVAEPSETPSRTCLPLDKYISTPYRIAGAVGPCQCIEVHGIPELNSNASGLPQRALQAVGDVYMQQAAEDRVTISLKTSRSDVTVNTGLVLYAPSGRGRKVPFSPGVVRTDTRTQVTVVPQLSRPSPIRSACKLPCDSPLALS